MSFLVDTNVISEIRKGARCDAAVASWWATVNENDLWLSALVLGEIRKWVEIARRRDPQKAAALDAWLGEVTAGFGDRILPVDMAVADEWGRIMAIRPTPVTDALLAATARTHGLVLVTRNEADVAGLGVDVLNPFTQKPAR
ncbi:MAG: type II toxin-antitoxin system VapC family toxin [Rubrimonas sp.]